MGNFNAQFHLLPPDLKLSMGLLAMDANTSRVNLVYSRPSLNSIKNDEIGLQYNYGKKIELFLGRSTSRLVFGVDPRTGSSAVSMKHKGLGASTELNFKDRWLKIDLSYVYHGLDISAMAKWAETSTGRAADYGFNIGARPLPFFDLRTPATPADMRTTFNDAGATAIDIWNRKGLKSNDTAVLGRAATLIPQIANAQNNPPWGAGVYVHMDERNNFTIFVIGTIHFSAGPRVEFAKPSTQVVGPTQ
ncbi:hypothetical protein [Terrarubrum flagellatum]|uniref:hypothetical protein n=1 Tax=Terrirubrum flagellatum TaxID=2895980 RepID=UPI00314548C1